jgi:hypothetical protein
MKIHCGEWRLITTDAAIASLDADTGIKVNLEKKVS